MVKLLRLLLVGGLALVVSIYFGVSYMLYDQLSDISGACGALAANRPDRFGASGGAWEGFDFSPYHMATYELVRFPSREAGIEIAGWYVEASPDAAAVILVHGLGSCKHALDVLIPAGMLWHAGFNVLLIDVRDTGDSTFEDGRSALGNEEYLDLLGAWDWLVIERDIPPERIGVLGNSLGAATALIAFSEEPRVAAVFSDSPFDNALQIIREELERIRYPTYLIPGGILLARLVSGDDVVAHDPADAMSNAGRRPLFILHGAEDDRIGVHHSLQLQDRAREHGARATFWIIEGVGHVGATRSHTAEYQERLVNFFRAALGN